MRVPTAPTVETTSRDASQSMPVPSRPARNPWSTALATAIPDTAAGSASGNDQASSAAVGRGGSDATA
jgi:hypothetical protein